jgi:hypothetical protein
MLHAPSAPRAKYHKHYCGFPQIIYVKLNQIVSPRIIDNADAGALLSFQSVVLTAEEVDDIWIGQVTFIFFTVKRIR